MLDKSLKNKLGKLSRLFFLMISGICTKTNPNAAFFLLNISEGLPERESSEPAPPYHGSKI